MLAPDLAALLVGMASVSPCPRSSRLCMFRFDCSYRAHCEVNRGADVWVMLGGGL